MTNQRRAVCWPRPDLVCADGGCGYCHDSESRKTRLQISAVTGVPVSYVWMPGEANGRVPQSYYEQEHSLRRIDSTARLGDR